MNTRDLGVHMATPLGIAGLGLTPPLVVWGRSQRAMLAGIDNRNRQLVWKWDLLILERRAIEQQRVAAPPSCGGELIHDADLPSRRALLGALARKCRLFAVHLGTQSNSHRHEQGGR